MKNEQLKSGNFIWNLIDHTDSDSWTYAAEVPGGYVLRVDVKSETGAISTSMIFIPDCEA